MKHLRALSLLLLISCASILASAQSTDATISGVVVDPSGKAITDAEIEVLNESTGVHYSSKTNETGIYTLPILPPGEYRVQVSKVGFKTLIKPGIILNVQSAVALNFTLPVGAASESITVEGGASQINTADASVSTVIDRQFVENIPLNGRSFQDLISMTPGIVTQSPQNSGQSPAYNGDFSVNGQRTESNYYIVDGVSGNVSAGSPSGAPQAASSGAIAGSTALGTTQGLLSVDALQEFRVESSTYSAEYGRSPGGQFSFLTRSGTNQLHGSAADYFRNNSFDANDWFNDHYGKSISPLRQNDFGGTVGGPIRLPHLYNGINRSFFFASYEGLRLTQPQAAIIQYVPDSSMRQQAPSALASILNAFPNQNGTDYGDATDPSLAQFIQPYSLPSRIDSTSVRVDHTILPRMTAFFRFADTPSSTSSRNLSTYAVNHIDTRTYTLGIDNQFTHSISNEFRLGHSYGHSVGSYSLDAFAGAVPISLASATGVGSYPDATAFFEIYLAGIGSTYIQTTTPENLSRQWNLVDTLNLTSGRHEMKFGVDYRRIASPIISAESPYAGYIFESAQAIATNSAQLGILIQQLNATPIFHEFAAFVQDQWRISPRLSLSAGVRWEIDPPLGEAHGHLPYTLLGDLGDPSTVTLAPQGTSLWHTSWYNFAPRLGVAWTVHDSPSFQTVLRSGGGVFFDTENELAVQGFDGVGFQAGEYLFNASVPVSPSQLDFAPSAAPPYTSSAVYAFPSHLQLPYTLQWNTSIEQALGSKQALTISYVGSNGRRLTGTQEYDLSSANPNFGSVFYFPNGITSNYQALQAKFQRSITHGIQALASYTWSHSLDFGSNGSELPLTRGNSDFDVRNNLQVGAVWDIPAYQRRIGTLLLNGWSADLRLLARSGFPVTLGGNQLVDPGTGSIYTSSVDLVPDVPVYLYSSIYPGGRGINKAAFSLPAGDGAGNAPRNFVRGFGMTQLNFAMRRTLHLNDDVSLQIRGEAFNILNHPNFGLIDAGLTDATFGQATMMLNGSLGTVASQYQQGGPRSLQIALKILF
jgi:hypothetical protein